MRFSRIAEKLLVDCVEILFAGFLMAKDLDDLLSVHHFLDIPLFFAERTLLLDKVLGAPAADGLCDDNHRRGADQHDKRQPHAEIQHDAEQNQHDKAGRNQARNTLRNQLTQRFGIVGVIAHDIAVRVRIEIFDGELLHIGKQGVPDVPKRSLRHIGHQSRPRKVADKTGKINTSQKQDCPCHLRHKHRKGGIFAAFRVNFKSFADIGDKLIDKERAYRACDGAYHKTDENNGKILLIIFHYELKYPEQRAFLCRPRHSVFIFHRRHLPLCFGIRIPRGRLHWTQEALRAFRRRRYGRRPLQ